MYLSPDMFTLPQPTSPTNLESKSDGSNRIEITEDAHTMQQLLSLVYPCGPDIDISTFMLARHVHLLEKSRKYAFDAVTARLTDALTKRAERNPQEAFTIFAVGHVFYLPKLVKTASEACLRRKISELEVAFPTQFGRPQLNFFPVERESLENILRQFESLDYQRLLKFHRKRTQQAIEIAQKYTQKPLGVLNFAQSTSEGCALKLEKAVRLLLVEELENKGPDLRNLLERNFMRELSLKSDLCTKCSMFASESIRSQIKYDLIPRMDALPEFAAMFGLYGTGGSKVSV
jgi:hypothetical protein